MWMISAGLPSSFLGEFTSTRWKHLVEHDRGSRSSCAWIRSVGHQPAARVGVFPHISSGKVVIKEFLATLLCQFFAGVSKILCERTDSAGAMLEQRDAISPPISPSALFRQSLFPKPFTNENHTGTVMSLKISTLCFYLQLLCLRTTTRSDWGEKYLSIGLFTFALCMCIWSFHFLTFFRLQTMDRSIVNPFAPKEARRTKIIAKSKLSEKIPIICLFQILIIWPS